MTGGEVKHAHYVGHVRRLGGWDARVAFTGDLGDAGLAAERARLWPGEATVAGWTPADPDVLFVAGTDWRYLEAAGFGATDHPRINLLQHLRHADPGTELWTCLAHPAVRICVSDEVADAVRATGRARGPVLAIPNGTELRPWDWRAPAANAAWRARRRGIVVVGYKRRELAAALARRLGGTPRTVLTTFLERAAFLDLLRGTRVAVCLPRAREGFYLPALEAMACGCLVVTLDCVGNRGFCRDGENCMVAPPDAGALADATVRAVGLSEAQRERLLAAAAETVATHSLAAECARFRALLADVDELWAEARAPAAAGPPRAATPAAPRMRNRDGAAPQAPLVDFMVVGAQKCGTTALASFLGQHPEIGMAEPKEAHLFDDPDYRAWWTRAGIDARYARCFGHCPGARLHGEATPVYLYFADTAAALVRYNPALKVIVLLRDPAERAVSHYHMQRSRGAERRPLWLALLLEPFVLLADREPRGQDSPTRARGYRARGRYGRQLGDLYRSFPRDRVLVLRQSELLEEHDAVLRRVFEFLGADPDVRVPAARVFAGGPRPRHRLAKWLLRLTYLADSARLRRLGVRL
ncbi:MAG: glycosyltransferase [Gammaproteobacteria bacterium]|nr:glycosyltransferase [Gammaproteobacteria bacterium]